MSAITTLDRLAAAAKRASERVGGTAKAALLCLAEEIEKAQVEAKRQHNARRPSKRRAEFNGNASSQP